MIRFMLEAELGRPPATIPNIVQIYEVGQAGTALPFFALEYVQGGTLEAMLRRPTLTSPRRAAAPHRTGRPATMHHVHLHGIVHRDLKPANILLQGRRVTPP